jgi:Skp family chaperone for outer membrane proteins
VLEAELDSIRAEHRLELQAILKDLDALSARVRDRLDS